MKFYAYNQWEDGLTSDRLPVEEWASDFDIVAAVEASDAWAWWKRVVSQLCLNIKTRT